MWNFAKLPENEHEGVLRAFSEEDWETLLDIHDKYELSPWSYCCGPWREAMKNYYGKAIKNGKIKSSEVG